LIPSLWLPYNINKPSQSIYTIFYIIGYIPIIFISFITHLDAYSSLITVYIIMLMGMYIMYLGSNSAIIFSIPINLKYFWIMLFGLTGFFLLYTIYIFWGTFKFPNFFNTEQVYEVRLTNIPSHFPFLGLYPITILSTALLPFLLVFGLLYKKVVFILISIAGQVLLYATTANKSFLISVVVTFIFFIFFKNFKNFSIKIMLALSVCMLLFTTLSINFTTENSGVFYFVTMMLVMRTIGIGGISFNAYYNFFKTHPFTYYSHVNIVKPFIVYPYGSQSLGEVIGKEVFNTDDINANATFFITDGIAAAGLPGILIISVLMAIVFMLINGSAKNNSLLFCCLMLINPALSLLNTSLFTTLFTGGLGLTITILAFYKTSSTNSTYNTLGS